MTFVEGCVMFIVCIFFLCSSTVSPAKTIGEANEAVTTRTYCNKVDIVLKIDLQYFSLSANKVSERDYLITFIDYTALGLMGMSKHNFTVLGILC